MLTRARPVRRVRAHFALWNCPGVIADESACEEFVFARLSIHEAQCTTPGDHKWAPLQRWRGAKAVTKEFKRREANYGAAAASDSTEAPASRLVRRRRSMRNCRQDCTQRPLAQRQVRANSLRLAHLAGALAKRFGYCCPLSGKSLTECRDRSYKTS